MPSYATVAGANVVAALMILTSIMLLNSCLSSTCCWQLHFSYLKGLADAVADIAAAIIIAFGASAASYVLACACLCVHLHGDVLPLHNSVQTGSLSDVIEAF